MQTNYLLLEMHVALLGLESKDVVSTVLQLQARGSLCSGFSTSLCLTCVGSVYFAFWSLCTSIEPFCVCICYPSTVCWSRELLTFIHSDEQSFSSSGKKGILMHVKQHPQLLQGRVATCGMRLCFGTWKGDGQEGFVLGIALTLQQHK